MEFVSDHVLQKQERQIFNSYCGCTVVCGKNVADVLLDQNLGHASHPLSVDGLNGWLYFYLDRGPRLLPIHFNDKRVRPHGRFAGLTLAETGAFTIINYFIQRGCTRIWTHCTRSCVDTMAGRRRVKVYYRLKG